VILLPVALERRTARPVSSRTRISETPQTQTIVARAPARMLRYAGFQNRMGEAATIVTARTVSTE
jgi:hypothetical protein